jgi:hypothetical protein
MEIALVVRSDFPNGDIFPVDLKDRMGQNELEDLPIGVISS